MSEWRNIICCGPRDGQGWVEKEKRRERRKKMKEAILKGVHNYDLPQTDHYNFDQLEAKLSKKRSKPIQCTISLLVRKV